MIKLGNDWDELLKNEFNQPYYLTLRQFLKKEYQTKKVFPDMYDIFNALKHTAYKDVKVVISRTRPISWTRSSTRALIFRSTRSTDSTITAKYLFRIT